MDKLKDLASKATSGGGSSSNTSANPGQEDYLDKGLDQAESRFSGGKIDPQKQRATNEKVTDFAREKFESVTGKNVPDKFSN